MNKAFALHPEEHLHLALHASRHGDHHAALDYLHIVLQGDPNHVAANYLLAAEFAELGLHHRARQHFLRVIAMQPALETARFQLGLLHLQQDDTDDAHAVFAELADCATDVSLRTFANGMKQLCEGHPAEARQSLRDGMADCANTALGNDMQRIIALLDSARGETGMRGNALPKPGDTATAAPGEDVKNPLAPESPASRQRPVFLGAYRNADS